MAPHRIPPPFREVRSDEAGERESSTAGSYQTAQRAPETLLVPAPWRTGAPAVEVDEDGVVRALVRPTDTRREFVLLPPYSPARRYQPDPVRRLKKLGTWSRRTQLLLEPDVLGNGVRGATLRARGDVVEFAGDEWVLSTGGLAATPPLGPLARAASAGGMRLETAGDGLRLVLGPGPYDSAPDSLERLRRVLASEWATRIGELVLHAWAADPSVDWKPFLAAHHHLVSTARFRLQLVDGRQSALSTAETAEELSASPSALVCTTGELRPLAREGADWCLRLGTRVFQWNVRPEGACLRLTDGSLDALVPWFSPTFARGDEGLVLIPGPSPFLAGQRNLPDDAPLTTAAVRVFADQLVEVGDVAGPLLAVVASHGGETSRTALEQLLSPWVLRSGLGGRGINLARSEHHAGFFTTIDFDTWPNFHLDAPTLLRHPLLRRLRQVRFSSPLPRETQALLARHHPTVSIIAP